MRKFSNQEAHDVEALVQINEQIRSMQRELKTLNDKQKSARELVKPIIAKHGEAHRVNLQPLKSLILLTDNQTRERQLPLPLT